MSVPRGAQTPSRTPEIPARHASPSIPFLRLPGAAVDLPASLPPLTESPSPTSERRLSFRSRLKNRLSPRLQALSRWKKEKRLLAYPLFDIGPDLLHHLCLFLSSNRVIALALTCQYCHQELRKDSLWNKLLARDFGRRRRSTHTRLVPRKYYQYLYIKREQRRRRRKQKRVLKRLRSSGLM
ncbi:MAG: hypothetical protein MHM6MM_008592 [Cercozoa sp. M6MM]